MHVKPGYKTTEFWLAVLPYVGQLVVVVLFGLGYIDETVFAVLMGSGFLGGSYASAKYSASRSEVKQAPWWHKPATTDEVADDSAG